MAAGFSVNVYGTVDQQPPYAADVNGNMASVRATWTFNQIRQQNFPTANVNIFAIQPGVKMYGGTFCYGVIELPATGNNQYSTKFVVKETSSVLATLRG